MAPPLDIGLSNLKVKEESLAHGSSCSMREPDYGDRPPPRFHRFINSFKPDTNSTFFPSDHLSQVNSATPTARSRGGAYYYDLHLAAVESAHTGLARKLKGRHLQMIAIGGSIGSLDVQIESF